MRGKYCAFQYPTRLPSKTPERYVSKAFNMFMMQSYPSFFPLFKLSPRPHFSFFFPATFFHLPATIVFCLINCNNILIIDLNYKDDEKY